MSRYVAAIDLGTTKIVTIIGEKTDNNRFRILAYDEVVSVGVRRGQVENIQNVIATVTPSINKVCQSAGVEKLDEVFVGIAGMHIRCIENRADVTRDVYEEVITEEEIRRLENSMYRIRMEPGEEVIHVIPQNYSVDDAHGVTDIVGRLGQRLSGNFHIIIGNSSSARHTEICIDRIGLKLKRLILEPLASARAVLSDDEKEMGVAMVDIGGGTTDLVIYTDGIVRHTAVIPFGGNIITEDIRKGCSILSRYAEQIKIQYGSCVAAMAQDNKVIAIKGLGGREPREISFKALANIIEARLDEIMNMVLFEITRCGADGKLAAGIVFTGGGALMTNLSEFIKLKTGLDVRIGRPEYVAANSAKDILHPKYATAVGLIMCGFDYLEGRKDEDIHNINGVLTKKEPIVEEEKKQEKDEETIITASNEKMKKNNILEKVLKFFEETKKDEV